MDKNKSSEMIERAEYLKRMIEEQNEWGNYKVAELFTEELHSLLKKLNQEIKA